MSSSDAAKNRFARRIVTSMRHSTSEDLVYDSDDFSITVGINKRVFLDNIYRRWLKKSWLRRQFSIGQMAAMALEATRLNHLDFAEAAPLLLPVIRSRWLLTYSLETDEPTAPCMPFRNDLKVCLAIDGNGFIQIVSNSSTLEKWGVTFEEALETAMANLRAISPPEFTFKAGRIAIPCELDDFTSSWLLIPEVFDSIPGNGSLIIVPVSRSMVVAARPATDVESAELVRISLELYATENHLLSRLPLIWSGNGWDVADTTRPGLKPLNELIVLERIEQHELQKRALEAIRDAEGSDVFVANLFVFRSKKDDSYTTFTTWTCGVNAYIPKSDAVIFVREDAIVLQAYWDDVVRLVGELVQVPRTDPPYYKLDGNYDDLIETLRSEGKDAHFVQA
ncbi:hypothetical protein [Chthonobacter albigriseus]|uniref:hypothetical protein n=1 Tax=Chthonobacter albigriseus TaxID=1683161 RepID=UPI0015EF34EE|nr:hypothetical protein [Chthonobacter albigriseus]